MADATPLCCPGCGGLTIWTIWPDRVQPCPHGCGTVLPTSGSIPPTPNPSPDLSCWAWPERLVEKRPVVDLRVRRDGVHLSVVLEAGRPCYVARFPDGPVMREAMLESSIGGVVEKALMEIDERWEIPGWLRDEKRDLLELPKEPGDRFLWALLEGAEGAHTPYPRSSLFHFDGAAKGTRVDCSTDRLPYSKKVQLVGFAIDAVGEGSLEVVEARVAGGINLLRSEWAVHRIRPAAGGPVYGGGRGRLQREIFTDLRAFPSFKPDNVIQAHLSVEGDLRFSIGALVQEVADVPETWFPTGGLGGLSGANASDNLSLNEMKDVLVSWLKADPNRKAEVMSIIPELMKEINFP